MKKKNDWKDQLTEPSAVITSSSNDTVKYIKSLFNKKYRDIHHRFPIEGSKMVSEALESDFAVELVVLSEGYSGDLLTQAESRGISILKVTEQVFQSMADTRSPQGVLAVLKQKESDFQQIIGQDRGLLVILDGIKDPGNLGTIIRTVDAVGGDGVILINECVDPYNPKAVRATMGSLFRIPVYPVNDAAVLLDKLSEAGWHIAASTLQGTDVFLWQGGSRKTILVIGSESHGVSQTVLDRSHSLIKVPMAGGSESLNASVAAGVMIYEIFRKGRKMDEVSLEPDISL